MFDPVLPELTPTPMKDRIGTVFVDRGRLDVIDGSFVLVDANRTRTVIPIGAIACAFLEPGTRVSHAAVHLAARTGTLLVWVGEAGVRLYAVGQPGGARSDRLLHQAKIALDETARLKVVRRMYEIRFGEPAPERRSVEQLRGIEGARVRALYRSFAGQHDVPWKARNYDPSAWDSGDVANRCLSSATACLYGISEAAVLAAGYAPAIGFIHTGKPLSFVYDVADLFKFDTVVPVAFKIAGQMLHWGTDPRSAEGLVRRACRDLFREKHVLGRIIPTIENVLAAGDIALPVGDGVVGPAFPDPTPTGDPGHRG